MNTQLEVAIKSLGPKYSPDLNLQLDSMVAPFDALMRNERFKQRFIDRLDQLLRKWYKSEGESLRIEPMKSFGKMLTDQRKALEALFHSTDLGTMQLIPVADFEKIFGHVQAEIELAKQKYRDLEEAHRKEVEAKKIADKLKEQETGKPKEPNPYEPHSGERKYRSESDNLYELQRILWQYADYISGTSIAISNGGAMLLRGDWGRGKSHLLADIATSNKKSGIPSLFLLGMHFPQQLPRTSIQQMLCPNEKLENYLAALNALAQTKGQRILFIIDAINEGVGKYSWRDSIAGLIHEFQQYPWIGLVISYRTTYETVVLPDQFKMPTVTHLGFEGLEDTAAMEFFHYYQLEQTIPLFNPEFSIPLFLKIFCQTMVNTNRKRIDHGFSGITDIFENFTKSINQKLGEQLNYPWQRVNPVQQTIDGLIELQMNTGDYVIEYSKAHAIAEAAAAPYTSHKNFLEELLKESLLIEDYLFDRNKREYSRNGISFSYERMIDQFKARNIINTHTLATLKKSFAPNGKLHKLIKSRNYEGTNIGVINAIAILLPEVHGIELFKIVPDNMANLIDGPVYNAILDSLVWRKPSTTNEKIWLYIKAHINASNDGSRNFFEKILLVCAHKGHYFNSDFLHRQLIDRTVAERDYIWSIPIDRMYRFYDPSSAERIINWCWSEHIDNYPMEDEVVLHIATVLAWLFTSSNRYIRDKASKAFTALFVSRVHLLKSIFDKFKDVNDPYVLERVVAGCYGAVSRSNDLSAIKKFVQYVYDLYFKTGKPPVNILTRDYAKCMVESAVAKGVSLKYKPASLNPPFKSVFPKDMPTEAWADRLDKIHKEGEKLTDEERGYFKILSSVRGFGDFSRYILGTNHRNTGSFGTYTIVSRQAYEKLKKNLRGNKKKFLDLYCGYIDMLDEKGSLGKKIRRIFQGEKLYETIANAKHCIGQADAYLKENCTREDYRLFTKAKGYIQQGLPFEKEREYPRYNLDTIALWILFRVFELGWTKEYFGAYDGNMDSHYRSATKAERIGKKYQWIAYYEIIAMLSDHYDFFGRHSFRSTVKHFIGAWQERTRNFDPTILHKMPPSKNDKDGERARNRALRQKNWWWPVRYQNWGEERKEWLAKDADLPNPNQFIRVQDPGTNEKWIVLESQFVFEEEAPLGVDRFSTNRKEMWIWFKAMLVKKKDLKAIMDGAKKRQHWRREQIPENSSYYAIYHGELYSGDAYLKSDRAEENKRFPLVEITVNKKTYYVYDCVEEMSVGDEYDCSSGRFQIIKPSVALFQLLDARFGKNDAALYNKNGEIIGIDTAIYYNTDHSAFLIKENAIEKLKDSGYTLLWHYFGEKEDIGSNVSYVYRRLFSGFVAQNGGSWDVSHYGIIEQDY